MVMLLANLVTPGPTDRNAMGTINRSLMQSMVTKTMPRLLTTTNLITRA